MNQGSNSWIMLSNLQVKASVRIAFHHELVLKTAGTNKSVTMSKVDLMTAKSLEENPARQAKASTANTIRLLAPLNKRDSIYQVFN